MLSWEQWSSRIHQNVKISQHSPQKPEFLPLFNFTMSLCKWECHAEFCFAGVCSTMAINDGLGVHQNQVCCKAAWEYKKRGGLEAVIT